MATEYPDNAWRTPSDFLMLGMLVGILAGIAEFGVRAFGSFVLHRPSHHDFGVELLWMLPLANMLLFGAVGVIIGLARIRWHGDTLTRLALAVLGAAAVYVILVHFRSLHEIVSVILSIGVGVRVADLLLPRANRLHRFVRRVAWRAIAAVVLTAIAFQATASVSERRELASLVPASTQAPNVLIVVMDAVRAANLSAYGYARATTPELERFARHSVRFERAIVTAPWTLPSHASMFTGRFHHELSADWDVPLDEVHPTLAEVLSDRGYVTAGFVANNFYGRRQFGLNRGFLHYESRKFGLGAVIAASKLGDTFVRGYNRLTHGYHRPTRMDAGEINERLLKWLPAAKSRPFFVFVNYFDAHEPYVAPPPFNRRFSAVEPPTRRLRRKHTKAELAGLRDAYDQTIAYSDSQLGNLLAELDNRRLLENTLVVVTSDHGEEFGEHGWLGHGNGLYVQGLQVPLLISFRGRVPGNRVIAQPVTLRDLPATVLDLVGLEDHREIPGQSLTHLWGSATGSQRITTSPVLSEVNAPGKTEGWYAVTKGDMKSIIVGGYHYIRNGDGREEIFDIISDPWERRDLAGAQVGKAALVTARAALDSATHSERRGVAAYRGR